MGERERVGVRELRQNLSRYLRRVDAGETLVVTENRRPVAVLSPFSPSMSKLDQLIAAGLATPGHGDVLDIEPATGPFDMSTEEALAIERRERLP